MSDLIAEMHRLLDAFVELEPDLLEVMVAERLLRTARDAIKAAVAADRCRQADPCECGHEDVPICCVAGEVTPDGNEQMPCHGDGPHPEIGCWCVCHGPDCPVSGGSVCRCDVADEPDQGLYLRSGVVAVPSDWEV
ncbi:hypothetical protein [Mycobacterium sp. 155]|uniref:hypothetical protein n=1 Tax=Mycobacterium sp. 155 TaxID=1157943 RepID=UPI000360FAA1|nr:hypothetical protein [Mycobacterium sp. 155]